MKSDRVNRSKIAITQLKPTLPKNLYEKSKLKLIPSRKRLRKKYNLISGGYRRMRISSRKDRNLQKRKLEEGTKFHRN